MTFSIIVPTFNSEKALKNCLDSIISQKCQDFEVIISDGVSGDRTLDIVKEYQEPRIKIFSEQDSGIYDAMNKAISKATGAWLLFLGSDDLLYNDEVLETVKKHLDSTTAHFVHGDVKLVGDTPWAEDGTVYRGKTSVEQLFVTNICHQSIFYSRLIFADPNVRYNLKYRVCADYDLNLFCASKYGMEYINVTVAFFNSGGMSSVQSDFYFAREKWLNIVSYFQKRLFDIDLRKQRSDLKKTWKRFLKRFLFSEAYLAFKLYLITFQKRT